MKRKKVNRQLKNWRYVTKKTPAVLAYYCLIAVVVSLLTAAAAAAQEGVKSIAGGAVLLGGFYCRDLVEKFYGGLDGIALLLLRAVGYWTLVLGVSFTCAGMCLLMFL